MTSKNIYIFLIILLGTSIVNRVTAQDSPADDYYNQQMGVTPGDSYYERSLRASGPEPGGPGGPPGIDDGSGGEIDGGFVGGEPVPVGDVSILGLVLMGSIAFAYKKAIKRKRSS